MHVLQYMLLRGTDSEAYASSPGLLLCGMNVNICVVTNSDSKLMTDGVVGAWKYGGRRNSPCVF